MPTQSRSSENTDELEWASAPRTDGSGETFVSPLSHVARLAKKRHSHGPGASDTSAHRSALPGLPPAAPAVSTVTYICVRIDSRGRVPLSEFLEPGSCALNVLTQDPAQVIITRGSGHKVDSRGRILLPLAFRLLHHWREADSLFVAADSSTSTVTLTAARDVLRGLS